MDKTTQIVGFLNKASIEINGSQPWDMHIHHPGTLSRIAKNPSLGAGESYMDGWWDCLQLDEFFSRIFWHTDVSKIYTTSAYLNFKIKNMLINPNSKKRSLKVAEQHYNIGNNLYVAMLGDSMAYTCGYWKNTNDLTQAQNQKYDLVCRKLNLQPGEKVLELGCGFGGFARHAAQHYGVEITAVNISHQQMAYAKEICKDLPVKLFECDYRDRSVYNPTGKLFDKIVSIGLCEHIGYREYKNFLCTARANLVPDGLFLLHTIGKNISIQFSDPWIQKYIFPSGILPTVAQLSSASEPFFVIEDIHNIGADYDKTLIAWYNNFKNSWPQLKNFYNERFYRMWCYYLLSCAGGFRSRSMQLFQFVFSPKGKLHGYQSIR